MQHRYRRACAWWLGALIAFSYAWPGAGRALSQRGVAGVERVSLVASDLARAQAFFTEQLGAGRARRSVRTRSTHCSR